MVIGKSLKDFQTDPPIHPCILEMTPINLMYCESDPPLPHLIAVETTKIINILATINCAEVQYM